MSSVQVTSRRRFGKRQDSLVNNAFREESVATNSRKQIPELKSRWLLRTGGLGTGPFEVVADGDNSLRGYVYPLMGTLPVSEVDLQKRASLHCG